MIEPGEVVRHLNYGVGIVHSVRQMDRPEGSVTYYVIELVSGERLMIPADRMAKISPLDGSQDAILQALASSPQALENDFRLRQKDVQQRLDSGDVTAVAEVLRDLLWRKRSSAGLSTGDKQLMTKAKRLLAGALVTPPNLDMDVASECLEKLLRQMVRRWAPGEEPVS
jgi:CarD family transcriptional regulator